MVWTVIGGLDEGRARGALREEGRLLLEIVANEDLVNPRARF